MRILARSDGARKKWPETQNRDEFGQKQDKVAVYRRSDNALPPFRGRNSRDKGKEIFMYYVLSAKAKDYLELDVFPFLQREEAKEKLNQLIAEAKTEIQKAEAFFKNDEEWNQWKDGFSGCISNYAENPESRYVADTNSFGAIYCDPEIGTAENCYKAIRMTDDVKQESPALVTATMRDGLDLEIRGCSDLSESWNLMREKLSESFSDGHLDEFFDDFMNTGELEIESTPKWPELFLNAEMTNEHGRVAYDHDNLEHGIYNRKIIILNCLGQRSL